MEIITITEKNPELLKDVKIFKLMLMPLEIYVMKFFVIANHPVNIREIYTTAIDVVFNLIFNIEDEKAYFRNQIYNGGYGYVLINSKEKEKILKKYVSEIGGKSETKIKDCQLSILKEIGTKTPSYDKFKNIFDKLEMLGIIKKIGKEGKGIMFTLNLKFYNAFKDKFEEIKEL